MKPFFCALCLLLTGLFSSVRAYDSVVVFNEIQYNPPDGGSGEWIELHNQNAVNVDMSGWRLAGAVRYTFPDGTVAPGKGLLVVAQNPGTAGIPGALGPLDGGMKSPSDLIQLLDNNGRIMDELEYGDSGEWTAGADGTGATLSKRHENAGSAGAESWTASVQKGGTPGAVNFPPASAPVTTRVVEMSSAWRFLNTGAAPAADWTGRDFDDSAWAQGEGAFTFGGGKLNSAGGALRENIRTIFNSGVDDTGKPLAPGQVDPHYTNTGGGGGPVLAMSPNGAWVADDGASRFIGFTASGDENAEAGEFTFRTAFDLSGYNPGTAEIRFFAAADNSLDSVRVNGAALAGASWPAFNTMSGAFPVAASLLNPQQNTVDFRWTNATDSPNPGGIRIKWEATAEPKQGRTVLPANPLTTWFRKEFTLTGTPGTAYSMSLEHGVDDGAVFYLNGHEIHRTNMPEGAITASTPALTDKAQPELSGGIMLPGTWLQSGKNVLAVEVHQAGEGNADAFFGCTLDVTGTPVTGSAAAALRIDKLAGATDAGGFVVDLRNASGAALDLTGYSVSGNGLPVVPLTGTLAPGALLSLDATNLGFRPAEGTTLFLTGPGEVVLDTVRTGSRARARDAASGKWLSPSALNPGGAAAFTLTDSIVINEIMYHHQPQYLPTGTVEDPEEWVELYNKSNAPVDLSGWQITGGVSGVIGNGTVLAPGGYLVLAKDPAALTARYPGLAVAGSFSGSLSNSGELIRLEDAAGNPVDEVSYKDDGRWDGRADGGGSSLELRDVRADNSLPESWAASDESRKAEWQTFTYEGRATPPPGSNDPTQYREFIMGLLNAGECLIDDIMVTEKPTTGAEKFLIQNGTFEDGTTAKWRLLGTHGSHGRSVVVDDPAGAGKALKLVATGPAEHMHNHAETTLKNGATFLSSISTTATYTISFRARWVSGCPRLHTRLYFNRLAKQHLLPVPVKTGTPGAVNSRAIANAGPVFREFSHLPPVPKPGDPVTVRVKAGDPDSVAAVTLKWRRDAATPAVWTEAPMTQTGEFYEAVIPAQAANAQAEFYVEARDGAGTPAVSAFPAGAPAANALVKWISTEPPGPGHSFRILMTAANQTFLHLPTNVMSNDTLPCTVIYQEKEVFYDTRASLKSSQRGRLDNNRVGFAVDFDDMQPFRGVMTTINLDRSSYGRGTTGSGNGQSEIIHWHLFNRAGGIPSMYNDMVYLTSPRTTHTGGATLTMAELNDPYLDGQYANGGDTPGFKWELIYYPTTTDGGVEGLKRAQPDDVRGINIGSLTSPDKEAYRWHFLINNARNDDDYSRIINLAATFRKTGAAYREALPDAIDVDQWLRCFAAIALAGIGDNYASAGDGWHNLKLYQRADGRILYLPWDMDFSSQPANAATKIQPDLTKMIAANPAYDRAFYGHLQDIMNKAFSAAYMGPWANHYKTFATAGGNWNEIATYVTARANFVKNELNSRFPQVAFGIATNGGAGFEEPGAEATLTGTAWVNVREIRVAGSTVPLPLTWTSRSAWQVKVPVAPGPNNIMLEAVDFAGAVAGTASISITGTGAAAPASVENLVISELNYHPANPSAAERTAGFSDSEDFEFVEIRNISSTTVLLSGMHFSAGLTWQAPAGAVLAPGATGIIPRRAAAFALRYPGVNGVLPEYYSASGNVLSNSGEEVILTSASGQIIQRIVYGQDGVWPEEADGGGYSLVRIAPALRTDPNDALSWRLSTAVNGSPGVSDALPLPANPAGDDNGNGVSNLAEYFSGGGAVKTELISLPESPGFYGFKFERAAGAEVLTTIEKSPDLKTWAAVTESILQRRTILAEGREEIVLRIPGIAAGTGQNYYRMRLKTD